MVRMSAMPRRSCQTVWGIINSSFTFVPYP
jgi:hypothetical protein